MGKLPQSSWFEEELLDFELVAADTAITLQELDAKKRGAAGRYVLFTRPSIPLSLIAFPQQYRFRKRKGAAIHGVEAGCLVFLLAAQHVHRRLATDTSFDDRIQSSLISTK